MTTIPVRNPRTGRVDAEIRPATPAEIDALAAELRAAQPGWRGAGFDGRIGVMRAFAETIDRHGETIGSALAVDTGRRALARAEVDGLQGMILRWCEVAAALEQSAEVPSQAFPKVGLQSRQVPYPLVGAISPWNFPLLLSFIDALPALLAGSAVIVKPSEVTPRFADAVRGAVSEISELDAVLRFIDGDGSTGAALVGAVDAVAFTGSVATGRKVAAAAAEAFIPAFLELGGKDPAIVMAGADIERAATAILRASVNASGQACQSLERIYVQREIHDDFVEILADKARTVKLSHPDPGRGIIGPLIFDRQADIIRAHLDDARERGAVTVTGGEVLELDGGWFVEATILTNVDHDMAIMREETFGPVMPVMAFDDTDEAVALANDSIFGLSAAVFGPDEDAAIAVAERIEAGGISINDAGLTSFIFDSEKNAFRCSGLGPSRMGIAGLTRFLRRQALYINRGEVLPIEAFAEG